LGLAAALVAAIPALATVGLLVVSFQDGRLEGPLGYTSTGAVQLGSVATAVAAVAALCAAQAVALLWAAAAEGPGPGRDPISETLSQCGPAAALACLTAIAGGIALGFASQGFLKEFGLGMAAGAVLELLVVQALLAPALLRLAPAADSHQ
jgi:trehalose monomycolate/heme transporter